MIGASTRVFAILGDPVSHSLSPLMHNAAFLALGLDAVYVAFRAHPGDVAETMRFLARSGGGGNVTIPHKEIAARAVDHPSTRMTLLSACNTFWGREDGIHGDNTDVDGVLEALTLLEAPATAWLVAGTGGGARAVAAAAQSLHAAIAVRSRNTRRLEEFESWLASLGVTLAKPEDCEVLINTTPLGLHSGDHLPLAVEEAPQAVAALDMVYAAGETHWIRQMRQSGLRAADGRAMLVAQGAAAFSCWFPDEDPPVEVMRAAVDGALR